MSPIRRFEARGDNSYLSSLVLSNCPISGDSFSLRRRSSLALHTLYVAGVVTPIFDLQGVIQDSPKLRRIAVSGTHNIECVCSMPFHYDFVAFSQFDISRQVLDKLSPKFACHTLYLEEVTGGDNDISLLCRCASIVHMDSRLYDARPSLVSAINAIGTNVMRTDTVGPWMKSWGGAGGTP